MDFMLVSVDPKRLKLTASDGPEGVLLGVLLGFRCRECRVYVFGPATFCQSCTSGSLEPVELSKRGVLYSYTIVRVPPAGWPGPVPYVLGQVELPEGLQVLAEVVDCPESDLKIGMAVKLALRLVKTDRPLTPTYQGGERARVAQGEDGGVVVYKWKPEQPGLEHAGEGAQ
jgi:hypothetical protein